jgi:hypothetical protein
MAQLWQLSAWVRAYDAALLEPEAHELPTRIEAARVAVYARLQELADGHHEYDQQELQALNKTLGNLRTLLDLRERTSKAS